MKEYITKELLRNRDLIDQLLKDEFVEVVIDIVNVCVKCLEDGNKILLAGNGGSAADAQHISAEFVSRFNFDRPGLAAIALTTDSSILTAIGNDYGYENLFSRQIDSIGQRGDVFLGISTSGNSANILKALEKSKEKGLLTVGLTGKSETEMHKNCDYVFRVPSLSTPKIQECHIIIGHMICGLVEQIIFFKDPK